MTCSARSMFVKSVAPGPVRSESPNVGRNPFCGKYQHCLNQAARLDLADIECTRCFFRDDQSGLQETREFLSSYLHLLKVIVHEDRHQTLVRLSPRPDRVKYCE